MQMRTKVNSPESGLVVPNLCYLFKHQKLFMGEKWPGRIEKKFRKGFLMDHNIYFVNMFSYCILQNENMLKDNFSKVNDRALNS